jgi:ketopantoate reductase
VSRLGREKGVPTPTIDAWIAIVKALQAKVLRPAAA